MKRESQIMSCLYFDVIEENEIAIGVTPIDLGTITTSDTSGQTVIEKTGGGSFLTYLERGKALKIGDEIRRVRSVIDANTVQLKTALINNQNGESVELDFISNDSGNSYSIGGYIEKDNFENDATVTQIQNSFLKYDKCTEFTGLNSILIYDDNAVLNDRKQMLCTGTFDVDTGDTNNVDQPFLTKPGRTIRYILNIEEDFVDSSNANFTVSGLNVHIYGIWLNGNIVDNSKYVVHSNIITITDSSLLAPYWNEIRIMHYPPQNTITGHTVRFSISSYDNVFITDADEIALYDFFKTYDNFNANPSPVYYDVNQKEVKQNIKIQINQANKLTFTVAVGIDNTDLKNIMKHLKLILGEDREFFRLIRFIPETDKYEYYFNCRITDGVKLNEGFDYDKLSYTIDYASKSIVGSHIWGDEDYDWGDFLWGFIGGRVE